jgi:hypothetical protein
MSKARLLQDYLIPGTAENENTLITNYWLEFVSARDEREQMLPTVRFTETDLREKVRDFQKQMNMVTRNNESLRQALGSERSEPLPPASSGAAVPCIPVSWVTGGREAKDNPFAQRDEGDFEPENNLGNVPQQGLSGLLMKLLGK